MRVMLRCVYLGLFLFGIATALEGHAATLQWAVSPGGAISNAAGVELSSGGGKAPLTLAFVATQPDVDVVPQTTTPQVVWIEGGKAKWKANLSLPAKSVALAKSGNFGVAATYQDEVLLWDRKGKLLWKKEGACRPEFVEAYSVILCTHDDDTDPRIAFDLFSLKGEKLYSHSIDSDLLDLKITSDQKFVLLSLTGARVELISIEILVQAISKAKAIPAKSDYTHAIPLATDAGEVAVYSSGEKSSKLWSTVLIAVASGNRQKAVLQLVQGTGELGAATPLNDIAVELHFSADGSSLFVHSHSAKGQSYALYGVPSLTLHQCLPKSLPGAFSVLSQSGPAGFFGAFANGAAPEPSYQLVQATGKVVSGADFFTYSSLRPPLAEVLLSQIIPNKTGSSVLVVWDNGELHYINL